ncbi:enoyl-CoA hydratase/isomerase family protein [Desulfatitalea alkaliphila]|uniref:Enoyl-CoA hydratase-related protein n=1 Tax=Desulfatitalea alkaliphila TaxID=2929485 RepID=A0AA41UJS9_9BACT|nr:enoyl-CoA hydratase-related protein [Desulfatitalea alkaliphila]MCJ8502290.1 enoyl-CoA hydratase-related protein [Desulfatitalea alkaliphila]
MEYSNIIVTTQDFVTTITLNRPPANSINLGIREELDHVVGVLETSRETRAVIITGAGEKGFCAGMDVSDIANIAKGPNGNDIFNRIEALNKPVIAAINGYALGGGCELAMVCHFRLIGDSARTIVGLPEVNLGITPGWGGIQRLPRIVGKSKALEMILFSKRLSPQDALAAGLVDRVVPSADLMKEAMALATTLSKRPPLAVQAVLEGMHVGMEKGLQEGLRVDREWSRKLGQSKDAVEGMTAFMEKREPVFKGE